MVAAILWVRVGLAPSVVKKQRERLRDEVSSLGTRDEIWPEEVYRRDAAHDVA
jgi:hypothetical protein